MDIFNKRVKIIIFAVLILLLLFVLIIFLGLKKPKEKPNDDVVNPDKNPPINVVKKEINMFRAGDIENIQGALEEFKKNHPEFTNEQIEFYREEARKGRYPASACEEREDVLDCISSIAFLKGEGRICGEIEEYSSDKADKFACLDAVLNYFGERKLKECGALEGNNYANCLIMVYSGYDSAGDCSNQELGQVRQMCKDVSEFKKAFMKDEWRACRSITDEKLRQYCLIGKMDNATDSDSDGLFDKDELLKYRTDPNDYDSDKDGYSDGYEVKNGYDPLGPGRLK